MKNQETCLTALIRIVESQLEWGPDESLAVIEACDFLLDSGQLKDQEARERVFVKVRNLAEHFRPTVSVAACRVLWKHATES